MRTTLVTILLSGLMLAPTLATPKPERPATVTLHCARKDLGEVLHKICISLGRNIYIGPGVTGTVTADFDRYPAEKALSIVLRTQDKEYRYKLVGNTIVVATPEKLQTIPDSIFLRHETP